MQKSILKGLRIIGGLALIIFGIAGLFLPGLQGILMIAGGIMLIDKKRGQWIKDKTVEFKNKFLARYKKKPDEPSP